YMGSNAIVFPILAIEEPEAHLHPSMQYKFLKFLKKNRKERKVRQIFVTTHSTHIASAVTLDEIICLQNNDGVTFAGYPGKSFEEDSSSKKYVQRFLDATKSDMLFANKIILVEGIAEQLLIPILANYVDKFLEDHHIAVINIGGRYFDHFLKLFDQSSEFAIPKNVACISDRDPVRRKKSGGKFTSCFPFEWKLDTENYEYKNNSELLIERNNEGSSIMFFAPEDHYSKTFEYDLILNNPRTELFLTESIQNREELTDLMKLHREGRNFQDLIARLREGALKEKIETDLIKQEAFDNSAKCDAIIAARYLSSIGKGENALELSSNLKHNLTNKTNDEFVEIKVPKYVKDAIEWICR
ncbi:MAG: AAA family ATPase, partial [Candidatus Paceibacterota bacterium]